MGCYITWYESEKAEIIEDLLDERDIGIEMLPTPSVLIEQDVLLCKDCFKVWVDQERLNLLSALPFPTDTKCFSESGGLLWER